MSIHKANIDVVAAVIKKMIYFLLQIEVLKDPRREYGSFQGERLKKTRLSHLL